MHNPSALLAFSQPPEDRPEVSIDIWSRKGRMFAVNGEELR
jgi:hypothetical protein